MSSKVMNELYLEGALQSICELMKSRGVAKKHAEERFAKALRLGYMRGGRKDAYSSEISRLADVCTRWQLEQEFVDRSGHPKPLRWNGKSGKLLRLVQAVVGEQDARDVANALVDRRLVRFVPNRGWVPKSRVVAPTGFRKAQVVRSSLMISRLLQTIIYNSDKNYRGDVLLEVMAKVPRLPDREIGNFKRFAKAQGLIFAKAVDDWLEARCLRNAKRSIEPSNETGVVAFAFVEPNTSRRRRRNLR